MPLSFLLWNPFVPPNICGYSHENVGTKLSVGQATLFVIHCVAPFTMYQVREPNRGLYFRPVYAFIYACVWTVDTNRLGVKIQVTGRLPLTASDSEHDLNC